MRYLSTPVTEAIIHTERRSPARTGAGVCVNHARFGPHGCDHVHLCAGGCDPCLILKCSANLHAAIVSFVEQSSPAVNGDDGASAANDCHAKVAKAIASVISEPPSGAPLRVDAVEPSADALPSDIELHARALLRLMKQEVKEWEDAPARARLRHTWMSSRSHDSSSRRSTRHRRRGRKPPARSSPPPPRSSAARWRGAQSGAWRSSWKSSTPTDGGACGRRGDGDDARRRNGADGTDGAAGGRLVALLQWLRRADQGRRFLHGGAHRRGGPCEHMQLARAAHRDEGRAARQL